MTEKTEDQVQAGRLHAKRKLKVAATVGSLFFSGVGMVTGVWGAIEAHKANDLAQSIRIEQDPRHVALVPDTNGVFVLENRSGTPVRNAWVESKTVETISPAGAPTVTVRNKWSHVGLGVIPPCKGLRLRDDAARYATTAQNIHFEDASGNRWMRSAAGGPLTADRMERPDMDTVAVHFETVALEQCTV